MAKNIGEPSIIKNISTKFKLKISITCYKKIKKELDHTCHLDAGIIH